jgi:hypothetical protein
MGLEAEADRNMGRAEKEEAELSWLLVRDGNDEEDEGDQEVMLEHGDRSISIRQALMGQGPSSSLCSHDADVSFLKPKPPLNRRNKKAQCRRCSLFSIVGVGTSSSCRGKRSQYACCYVVATLALLSLLAMTWSHHRPQKPVPVENADEWRRNKRMQLFGFDIATELDPARFQNPIGNQPNSHASSAFNTTLNINFRSRGGVIVFYHLAKTGGTTLRVNLHRYGRADPYVHIETRLLSDMIQYEQAVLDVEAILTRQNQTVVDQSQQTGQVADMLQRRPQVLVVEFHGILPSLLTLESKIQSWRQMAQAHHTGFMTFSLVREPISYQVSYFNFYMTEPCSFPESSGHCYNLVPSTEANLAQKRRYNHQCQLYAIDHWKLFGDNRPTGSGDIHVTHQECTQVYQSLQRSMDWVGTTTNLSLDTWPLLTQILWHRRPTSVVLPLRTVNEASKPDRLSVSSLSNTTRAALWEYSLLDNELYRNVTRDYVQIPLVKWADSG